MTEVVLEVATHCARERRERCIIDHQLTDRGGNRVAMHLWKRGTGRGGSTRGGQNENDHTVIYQG